MKEEEDGDEEEEGERGGGGSGGLVSKLVGALSPGNRKRIISGLWKRRRGESEGKGGEGEHENTHRCQWPNVGDEGRCVTCRRCWMGM